MRRICLQDSVEDVGSVYSHLRHDCNMSGPLILVGWSMGAAIAVKYACSTDDISGLVAIDVVEGRRLALLGQCQCCDSDLKDNEGRIKMCGGLMGGLAELQRARHQNHRMTKKESQTIDIPGELIWLV
eukprot:jgi/Picre1/32416/NNA_007762.t1